MKYQFTIDESTEPPTTPCVVFRAKSEARAYRFVIQHILRDPRNVPIKKGTLSKLGAFEWETMMVWSWKSGWAFPGGREPNIVDNRPAPGA